MVIKPGPIDNIPQPPADIFNAPTRNYLMRLVQSLTAIVNRKAEKDIPQASVLLVSPNGSVYTVKVTDAGALVATLVKTS